jgi:excisionase family DNA binding protein
MSIEETIKQAVADGVQDGVKKALESLDNKTRSKDEVKGLVTTQQAGKLLACTSEHIRKLQDDGVLSLVFLPGSKHRRVYRCEVEALIKKNTVRSQKPTVK